MTNQLTGLKELVVKNSPAILTGLAAGGVITTAVLAVKATPKAIRILEDTEDDLDRELTKKEVVKATYKCYIPAAVMGAATIACVIGANTVHTKRNAALASAYTLAEKSLTQFQNKAVETFGEKKVRAVKDEIAKEAMAANPINNSEVIVTGRGDSMCYDALSGRYFKSDVETVRQAINKVNRDLIQGERVSLNDLYFELGLSHTTLGDAVGWHVDDGLIEEHFTSHLSPDGIPCLSLGFYKEPMFMNDSFF